MIIIIITAIIIVITIIISITWDVMQKVGDGAYTQGGHTKGLAEGFAEGRAEGWGGARGDLQGSFNDTLIMKVPWTVIVMGRDEEHIFRYRSVCEH